MSTEQLQARLEAVEKRLHYMRIAIVVLVGFFVYDILSADGLGAPQQIIRGTVKAQEFVLLDDSQAIVGSWKGNNDSSMPVLNMYSTQGYRSSLSAESLSYFAGNKIDSHKQISIDRDGIDIHDAEGNLRLHLGSDSDALNTSDRNSPFAIHNSEGAQVFKAH